MNSKPNPNTHPTREELTRYLFSEAAGEPRQRLEAHLGDCPECARHVADMQKTLGQLNRWQIPTAPRRRRFNWRPLKWAAAATVLLGIGVGVGRFTEPVTPDIATLRAEITSEFQNQVRAAVSAEVEAALAASRQEDRVYTLALFESLQREHASKYLSLRKDLETLATLTDDQMLNTRRSILHIAAFAETAAGESNPK